METQVGWASPSLLYRKKAEPTKSFPLIRWQVERNGDNWEVRRIECSSTCVSIDCKCYLCRPKGTLVATFRHESEAERHARTLAMARPVVEEVHEDE